MNAERIPILAWIAIGIIVILLTLLNISLLAAWCKRKDPQKPAAKSKGDFIGLTRSFLNNPWQAEDEQWKNLKQAVSSLHNEDKRNTEGKS